MADESSSDQPLVRAAVRFGRALGAWRQRRLTAAQDAYIAAWKAAWTEGCQAGWQMLEKDAVPYSSGPSHDAWCAGWEWGTTHPDRRNGHRMFAAHDLRRA